MGFLLLCIILLSNIDAQSINTYIYSFDRTVIKNNGHIETQTGNLYSNNNLVYIEIKSPLNQILVIKKTETLIYYPIEKDAILISNSSIPLMPFHSSLLAFNKEDFGLTEKKFTLKNTKFDIHNKSMITYWKPPNNQLDEMDEVVLNYKNNNIVSIEAYDKRKKILTVTKFDGFIDIDNIIMPSSISTTEWYNNDESITDSIYIKNISIDKEIPNEIIHFQIPNDINIKEIKW